MKISLAIKALTFVFISSRREKHTALMQKLYTNISLGCILLGMLQIAQINLRSSLDL